MAELPLVQGFRTQVQNAPSPVLPQVSFAQQNPQIAYEAEARYQGAIGDVLDRMSRAAFGVASEMSQRAGLQFAAENPLTPAQLEAMSKGDVSNVNLGSPMNVFNAAVRKARAIEVSAHAEVEAREQLVKLMQRAEAGELSTDDVRSQIAALTNGYGSAIAKVDPDASFKYRASMATVGGRVIEKVAEFEGQKRVIANSVKVQRLMTTMQQEIALASTSKMPIDPATGKEMPVTQYIDALKQNFLTNATALIGPTAAAQYVGRIDKDISDTMVNAVAQHISTDPQFAGRPDAVQRLLRGDAGSASNAFQALLPDDKAKVVAAYMTADAQKYTLQQRAKAQSEEGGRRQLTGLFVNYSLETDPEKKAQLQIRMLQHPSLTMDLAKTLTEPPKTSETGKAIVEGLIRSGQITTEAQLWQASKEYGVYDKDLGQMFTKYFNLYAPVDGSYVKAKLRQAANVPEGIVQIDPKSDYAKKISRYEDEFLEEQRKAMAENRPFSAKETVDKIAKNAIASRETADVNAAKNQLKPYEEKLGGIKITKESYEALKYRVENGTEKRIQKRDLPVIKMLVDKIEEM